MLSANNTNGLSIAIVLCLILFPIKSFANTLPELIKKVKPSIIGVGSYQGTRRPPSKLTGTGFVVADGYHIVTNFHVLPENLDLENREKLVIFFNDNKRVSYRSVKIIDTDREHDLALLRIEGTKLSALPIEKTNPPLEGESVAFTGFPIGAVLGLFPVTHQGIIAAISPLGIPVPSSASLNSNMIKRLQRPYMVYQLDATAYPGNSGSPLFSQQTGQVIGVINKVFIKESKETVLQKPSGITYAIPGKYVTQLLQKNKLSIN